MVYFFLSQILHVMYGLFTYIRLKNGNIQGQM